MSYSSNDYYSSVSSNYGPVNGNSRIPVYSGNNGTNPYVYGGGMAMAPPRQQPSHSPFTVVCIVIGSLVGLFILICLVWCICECIKNCKEEKDRKKKTIQFEFGEKDKSKNSKDDSEDMNDFEKLIENGRKSLQDAFSATSEWFKKTFNAQENKIKANNDKGKKDHRFAAPLNENKKQQQVRFNESAVKPGTIRNTNNKTNNANTGSNQPKQDNVQIQNMQNNNNSDNASHQNQYVFGDAGSEMAQMSPGTYMNRASNCDPDWAADNSSYANNLNVNKLMPASWRNEKPCTALNDTDTTEWAAYAPSKQAFDSYITTAGSARLAVNTRSAISRQTGMPNPLLDLRGGGGPPVPIGSNAMTFNDSDARQSIMYDATGVYPELNWC